VLVSERFWQSQLAASRDLTALLLRVNGQPARVAGVVGDDFEDPGGVYAPDLFVPLTARGALAVPKAFTAATNRWLTLVARPKPGATADAIRNDVLPIVRDEVTAAGGSADEVRVAYSRIADGHPSLAPLRRIVFV